MTIVLPTIWSACISIFVQKGIKIQIWYLIPSFSHFKNVVYTYMYMYFGSLLSLFIYILAFLATPYVIILMLKDVLQIQLSGERTRKLGSGLFERLKSVVAGIRTHNLPHAMPCTGSSRFPIPIQARMGRLKAV